MTTESLSELLTSELAAGGPLRFDRYMARALFDPAHGYYASGRARIGREGDFYTNVSVGRMFGRVLATQCAEIWERLGEPADFHFVEQGANDGRLAADLIDALREDHSACARAIRYILVEPFPAAAAAQRQTLAGYPGCVEWVESLDALPAFSGIHFTNEYADALPVRLFIRQAGQWLERHVAAQDGGLQLTDLPCTDAPAILPADLPEGYQAEVRPEANAWVANIARKLLRGAMLIVDYGFSRDQLYAPWRTTGTLSCYRAHRRDDDPLDSPGDKDITAHVDFTALAGAGMAAGLQLAGFTDQYHFLVGAATALLLTMETAAPSPQRDVDLRALKTLLHPEMMGTQFKYLTLTRGMNPTPALSGYRHARPAAETLGV